jgi:hypothetical protein
VLWFRDSCLRPWVSLLLTAICVVVRTGVLFVLKGSDVKYSRITVLQLAGMYSDLVFLWLAMSELSDSIARVRCLTNLSIYGGRTNRLAPPLFSPLSPQILLCKKKIPCHIKISVNAWSTKC